MSRKKNRNRNIDSDHNIINSEDIDTGEVAGILDDDTLGAIVGTALSPTGTVAGGITGAALFVNTEETTEENDDPNVAD